MLVSSCCQLRREDLLVLARQVPLLRLLERVSVGAQTRVFDLWRTLVSFTARVGLDARRMQRSAAATQVHLQLIVVVQVAGPSWLQFVGHLRRALTLVVSGADALA